MARLLIWYTRRLFDARNQHVQLSCTSICTIKYLHHAGRKYLYLLCRCIFHIRKVGNGWTCAHFCSHRNTFNIAVQLAYILVSIYPSCMLIVFLMYLSGKSFLHEHCVVVVPVQHRKRHRSLHRISLLYIHPMGPFGSWRYIFSINLFNIRPFGRHVRGIRYTILS